MRAKSNVIPLKMTVFIIITLLTSIAAGQPASSKILFVYLNFNNTNVTLQKTKVVDGTLKTERIRNKGNIYYEVFANNGKMISSNVSNISKTTFYDYCGHDGQLKGGTRNDENKLIVLRLPYVPVMKSIYLYSTKTTKKPGLSKTNALRVEKDSLLAIIPLNVDKNQ